jgi:hypothetical protein
MFAITLLVSVYFTNSSFAATGTTTSYQNFTYYTFTRYVASNGVKLAYIKTSPKNISITTTGTTNKTVPNSGKLGMNGGFFEGSSVLSIAATNNIPVKGTTGYGTGDKNYNASGEHAAGTLVWNAKWSSYFIQKATSMSELWVSDVNNYWAQGGISMSLNDDANWESIADSEDIYNKNGYVDRSALVYNSGKNIFLIITEEGTTAAKFRAAIKEIEPSTTKEGIFLDGADASQMYVPAAGFSNGGGTDRAIPAMIAVVHNVDL